jgi:hypothetical protein
MSFFIRFSSWRRPPVAAFFVAGLVLAGSVSARAQVQVKSVKVDKPDINMLKTPEFDVGGTLVKDTPRRREWLEIDVKFEVEGQSASGYIDSLLFKYYVVLDDDKKTMLVMDVTHVNVPMGEELWSSAYVSPSSLDKLLGKEKGNERSVEGYAVEILYQGQAVGGKADPSPSTRWWQSRPATPGLLLSKDKTPFAPLWWDRYAEIQVKQ